MEHIFRGFALCILLISVTGAMAQDTVSKEYDEGIQKIIDEVEATQEGPGYSNKYQPRSDLEKKVNERLEQYCLALANENWRTVYDMMTKAYRDVVSFSKFLSQKRLTLHQTLIDEVKFNETCALAMGYYFGEQGGSGLDSLKIPLRIYVTLEEGEWRVFKNPYENSMGITLPHARKFKVPCDF